MTVIGCLFFAAGILMLPCCRGVCRRGCSSGPASFCWATESMRFIPAGQQGVRAEFKACTLPVVFDRCARAFGYFAGEYFLLVRADCMWGWCSIVPLGGWATCSVIDLGATSSTEKYATAPVQGRYVLSDHFVSLDEPAIMLVGGGRCRHAGRTVMHEFVVFHCTLCGSSPFTSCL